MIMAAAEGAEGNILWLSRQALVSKFENDMQLDTLAVAPSARALTAIQSGI